MKVQPVASPHQISQAPQESPQARTARLTQKFEAIIAKNTGQAPTTGQAQETPVANPNAVSVEELSAIKPQTEEKADNLASSEDTAPPEETKPEPKDPALTRQFAQLARQERQLRAKAQADRQAIAAERAEIAKQRQEMADLQKKYSDGYISRDELKANTLRVLADNQVSYDDLTQQLLNQPAMNPQLESTINALKAEIKALKGSLDEGREQQTKAQQDAYKAAVKQIELDVRQAVQNDPNFETIRATKSVSDVVELIEETYKKDGRLLTVEEACEEVENYLVEESLKLTRIGKIKRQLEKAAQPNPAPQKTPATNQQPQMKTLTNAAASTRKLSARERAMLAFKNELK